MNIPGSEWRVLAHDGEKNIELKNRGIFDELVVGKWLHIEQMNDNRWWIRIADARIDIQINENGKAILEIERNVYEEE